MGGSEVGSGAVDFSVTIVSLKEVTGIIILFALTGDTTPGLAGTNLTLKGRKVFFVDESGPVRIHKTWIGHPVICPVSPVKLT